MFDLKICPIYQVADLAVDRTHIVSLLDPGTVVGWLSPHHLSLHFSDVSDERHPQAPNDGHMDAVFAFSAGLGNQDQLLVHCHAGVSRSTAAAIGIMIQHGMSIGDAVKYVGTVRPIMHPNKLILRLVDQRFDLNGDLVRAVEEWERDANVDLGGYSRVKAMDEMRQMMKLVGKTFEE